MATNREKTPQLSKGFLETVPGVTALVVSVGFALGSANLFGKTFALGSSATEFLSVSDLATATVRFSPIAIIIIAAQTLFYLVFPQSRKAESESFPTTRYRIFIVLLSAMAVLFWTVKPSIASGLIMFASIPMLFSFVGIALYQSEVGTAPPWSGVLAILMAFVGMGFLNSYYLTLQDVVGVGNREPKAEHLICIQEECRQGLLIARFEGTSVIRWVPELGLHYIPNDRITQVSIAAPVTDRPIFNLWGWLGSGWQWISNSRSDL